MQQRVYVTPTKERKETLTGAGEGAVRSSGMTQR